MIPDVSIIILSWNTRDLLARCLEALYDTLEGLTFDVWVVDNASTDDSVEMVQSKFPSVYLVTNFTNEGFARANNNTMPLSQGRYMLLLNSDAFVTSGAVRSLVSLADAQPHAGIVGARLLNLDGTFQASHTPFPTLWREFLILTGLGRLVKGYWYPSRGPEVEKGPQLADYVEGACMLVRRQAFEEVGGLDEGYFMYSEEVDWCYSMREHGWQVWYQPDAKVIHVGGGSSQLRMPQREADLYRSLVRFFRKYYGERKTILLTWQIHAFTALKIAMHGLLRFVSGGRWGRPVARLQDLRGDR